MRFEQIELRQRHDDPAESMNELIEIIFHTVNNWIYRLHS